MAELGGGDVSADCFLARHVALLYYWIVVVLYIILVLQGFEWNRLTCMSAIERSGNAQVS
jgi:hypothetical protein